MALILFLKNQLLLSIEYSNIPIENLYLNVRTFNCLYRANIIVLKDFKNLTKSDLYKIKNMGKQSVDEIVNKLEKFGIYLPD